MAYLDALVVLGMDTAIGRDAAVNTYHFQTENPSPSDTTTQLNIATALKNVYDAIDTYLSQDIDPSLCRLKLYDAEAAPPRAPLYDNPLSAVMAPGTSSLPHELAICASFQGAQVSGVPQRRRRGRVYIGPLSPTAMTTTVVAAAAITAINAAFKGLADAGSVGAGWRWSVFSRVGSGPPPATPAAVEVVNGWCDNAFDIQRRRGTAGTSRNAWVATT